MEIATWANRELNPADADEILNFAMNSPYVRKMLAKKLTPEPGFKKTPIDTTGRLGKPVFVISPHQYKKMRQLNDLNKAELRRLLNEPEVLSEENEWTYAYTI